MFHLLIALGNSSHETNARSALVSALTFPLKDRVGCAFVLVFVLNYDTDWGYYMPHTKIYITYL